MARKVKPRQIVELEIEKVAFGGKGVAHIDDFVVFVDNTLPGDRVSAKIKKSKKNYAEAYALEILVPSTFRQKAKCQHFGNCGGCKWQNIDYLKQLQFKKEHVVEALKHIGNVEHPLVKEILPAPEIFGYRNKMEFSFSANRWLTPEELKNPEIKKSFALGLHVPRFFDRIIQIDKCWIQPEEFNQVLQFSTDYFRCAGVPPYHVRAQTGVLRHLVLRQSLATKKMMVNLVTSSQIEHHISDYAAKLTRQYPMVSCVVNTINSGVAQVARGDERFTIYGEPVLIETLGKFKFEISPDSFFQTNSRQAENLYNIVKHYAEAQDKIVWDLYCGTGSIGIYVAENARKVVGFEIEESAIKDAYRNAALNGIQNCDFISGDLRFSLSQFDQEQPDVIICDPPRSGMHKDVLKAIFAVLPKHIIYVSCNPATLARDLVELAKYYQIVEVQPVDMFPHTYHIESVVKLRRKS